MRLRAVLPLTLCSPLVYADGASFAAGTTSIPPLAWVILVIVAAVGGFTSILMQRSANPPKIQTGWKALATAMWMSLVAGGIGFLISLSINLDYALTSVMIFSSALGGVQVVEASKMFAQSRLGFNKPKDSTPPTP